MSVQAQTERVFPGRVIARLADGADPAAVGRANGMVYERSVAGGRLAVFNGAVGSERASAARLGTDASVLYAEPDYLRQTTGTGIDPRLWAFYNPGDLTILYTRGHNSGQTVTSYLSVDDADIDNVQGYAAGGDPVSIASIDTGVQMDHPEFGQATLIPGWDYFSDDPDPSDTNDHGTHTTGTMVGDNVGVAGVSGAAPNVSVYVYRVCGPMGCPTSAIVSAIYAATDAGVVAMNLSLGGSSESQAEADAILYATNHGALVVASAGNDGTSTISCPACDDNAISVAASDWLDEHAYYTNYGTGLDLTAPGGEMYSNTTEESGIWSSVRGGYAYFQGTSMAAPQVTGTAAIVASVTGLRGTALRSRIEGTADDLGPKGYDTSFGWGRVNAYRAVTGSTLDEGSTTPPAGSDPLAASFVSDCTDYDCTFDGSGSTGSITAYAWSTSDGGSGTEVTFGHTFPGDGDYTVQLTVGDGSSTDTATQLLQCRQRGPHVRCR